MGNLGPMEIMVIAAIALIVLGPKKLPDFGRGLGKTLREFNRARNDFMESLNDTSFDDDDSHRRTRSGVNSWDSGSTYSGGSSTYPDGTQPHGGEPHASAVGLDEPEDALPYGGDFQTEEPAEPVHAGAAAYAPILPPGGSSDDGLSRESHLNQGKD